MQNESKSIIIYNTADCKASVSLFAKDGMVWMNQNQLAELFDTSKQNISLHIINILKEGELTENSVVKDYLTTAAVRQVLHRSRAIDFVELTATARLNRTATPLPRDFIAW